MTFLPVFSDDELSAEVAAVAAAQVERQGHPLTTFQRTLLGDLPSFVAYAQLELLGAAVVPFLGERAVNLFSWAFSEAAGSDYWTAQFRRVLRDSGENLDELQVTELQVTETEQLMIDWARLVARDPESIPVEVYGRVEAAFTPRHRLAMLAYAGQLAAAILVASVSRLAAE